MSKPNREALQRFLNSKGAALVVDGAVGPKTRAAAPTLARCEKHLDDLKALREKDKAA